MALLMVQRSPCESTTPNDCQCQTTDEADADTNDEGGKKEKKGVSECYFAVKGAALVLPHDECLHVYRKQIANGANDIQQHLQSMLYLLHSEDILKMAVKLESVHNGRKRYLVVAVHSGEPHLESCLLGFDCNNEATIGLVLPVLADTRITLDGDGGFSVTSSGRHHIFKPVSVQAMWSALQTLHKASSKARECNYFKSGSTHQWIEYYEKRISSDRSCLNEWHAMDDLESRRPPSPDPVRFRPTERDETEKHIRAKLKELMMSLDLDEVTSKYIRTKLEEMLDMNLKEFKSFIDQEMLTILGQMDSPTEIFKYLYLGSEWNASNLDELVDNEIGYILNVTREIDNFFPGLFDYQNIRVYDDETTEILQYWDKTYRYIRKAKEEGSKVLVHCKMGISRSASVVIAYVMKAYDWNLKKSLEFVKNKRNCIKPNSGFLKQLEIYQGILDASKHRNNSLWRSKSETNLKSNKKPKNGEEGENRVDGLSMKSESLRLLEVPGSTSRPKSWCSPNDSFADMLFPPNGSISHDALSRQLMERNEIPDFKSLLCPKTNKNNSFIPRVSSIKDRISELESFAGSSEAKVPKIEVKSPTTSRSGLVLKLSTQFEFSSKPSSPIDDGLVMKALTNEEEIVEPVVSQTKPPVHKHHAVLVVKPALWSEENLSKPCLAANTSSDKIDVPAKPLTSRLSPFSSVLLNKGSTEDKVISPAAGSNFSDILKTSQNVHDSAFKPVPAKISKGDRSTPSFSCHIVKSSPTLKRHLDNNNLAKADKAGYKNDPSSAEKDMDASPKVNLIYDKEDIPFAPGTVQRTKQQLEEKNLTRTTSFDSAFPLHLMPSPPVDVDWGKPVRRSRSLRCDHRPSSMFCGKWYPLPALASASPKPFKVSNDPFSSFDRKLNAVHSMSTPSVVEAVNEVICGTKDVISSAIQFIPHDKFTFTSTHLTDDFGSANSLPDIDVFSPSMQSESPIPGIVRQQCEILESRNPKEKNPLKELLRKADVSKDAAEANPSLVSSDAKSDKDLGLVKRLTKELEAKSSVDLHRKDKISPSESDSLKVKDKEKSISVSESRNVFLCSDISLGPRKLTGLRSSLPSSVEKKLSCNNAPSMLAPPTPHRKTSLDLNFLRKSSRFPLTLKLRSQSKSESAKECEASVTSIAAERSPILKLAGTTSTTAESADSHKTTGRPPHGFKVNPLTSSEIPSPPPLPSGIPRKTLRKQHGSTHPISRLTIRQRHTNSLYNTM